MATGRRLTIYFLEDPAFPSSRNQARLPAAGTAQLSISASPWAGTQI